MPNRRVFLTSTIALLAARGAWAQDKGANRVYRIGIRDTQPAAANAANLVQFQKGMKDLGYTEGRNLTTEYRFAENNPARLQQLAAVLAGKKVDVIVTRGTPATFAAKNAPGDIP